MRRHEYRLTAHYVGGILVLKTAMYRMLCRGMGHVFFASRIKERVVALMGTGKAR